MPASSSAPLRLLLLLLLLLTATPCIQAFNYYLVEEGHCHRRLAVGEKFMGKPIKHAGDVAADPSSIALSITVRRHVPFSPSLFSKYHHVFWGASEWPTAFAIWKIIFDIVIFGIPEYLPPMYTCRHFHHLEKSSQKKRKGE